MWYNNNCLDEQNIGAFCVSETATSAIKYCRQNALRDRTPVLTVRLSNGSNHEGHFAMAELNFTCTVCGKRIHLPPSKLINRKYCSNECAHKDMVGEKNGNWKGGLSECICKNCGNIFYVKPSHLKAGEGNYCSKDCHYEARRGIKMPQLRNRITKYCKVCGKKIEIKKSHADVEGSYCSMECRTIGYKKSGVFAGSNNQNWHGGKVELMCVNCGDKYYRTPALVEKSRFCSRSCMATWRIKNEEFDYMNRSYKSGKREDLEGLFVRSSWEANYARYLNWLVSLGEIKSWEYEVDEFTFPVKRGNVRYLPDFKITNNDESIEYHEVKGYMDNDSRVKLKRMTKYYPNIKVIVVDRDYYKSIEKQASRIVEGWE